MVGQMQIDLIPTANAESDLVINIVADYVVSEYVG